MVFGLGAARKWGLTILLMMLRSWKNQYPHPSGVFTGKTGMLQGLVEGEWRLLDVRLLTTGLSLSFASGFKGYWGSLDSGLVVSIWNVICSDPFIFPMSVGFLVHRVSDTVPRSLCGVYIKYNERGKGISRAGTTLLWIEESSGTSRNSLSSVHWILQFHLLNKVLPIKSVGWYHRKPKILLFSQGLKSCG